MPSLLCHVYSPMFPACRRAIKISMSKAAFAGRLQADVNTSQKSTARAIYRCFAIIMDGGKVADPGTSYHSLILLVSCTAIPRLESELGLFTVRLAGGEQLYCPAWERVR